MNIHDLSTSLNYLSSNVLSLYCIFDVQNLVLCLTRELIKFIDYKIMLILQCKATLILPLLEKKSSKSNKSRLGNNVFFKMWFYMKYIVKYYSDRILLACLCTSNYKIIFFNHNYLTKNQQDIWQHPSTCYRYYILFSSDNQLRHAVKTGTSC